MKNTNDSVLKELEEAKAYCHVIRNSILWIAETILFTKQYVGWKIPIVPLDTDGEIDWKDFEEKHNKEYKAFISLELFSGLNNDFLHFTNFSLKSLHPSTMAVSYTLARKPFRDNLIYLEYLYARQDEFLHTFLGNNPDLETKDLDNKIKNERLRPKLILEASEKLKKDGSIHVFKDNPNHIYEFRYKTEYTSFFDSAIHLITSQRGNQTEAVNMNFIFLSNDPENAEQHARHLLRMHLTLLSYSYELMYTLMIKLFSDFFTNEDVEKMIDYLKYLQIRRIMSVIAFLFGHRILSGNRLDKKTILLMMKLLKKLVTFKCSCCGSKSFLHTSLDAAKTFIFEEIVICSKCKFPCKVEKPLRLSVEYET
ncbi:hypothetical protein IT397_03655 [Candidatus Nomurabacteria bacterium]|nr:hypothetical protein [Candidatus Nomurabacteria bacterium]